MRSEDDHHSWSSTHSYCKLLYMSFWLETRMWLDDKIICRTFWLLKLYKYISCLVCLWVQNNNNIHHHLLFLLVCNLRRHRQRKMFIELLVAAAGLTIHSTRAQHRQDRKKASSQFFINITSPGEKSFIHPVISNQVGSVQFSVKFRYTVDFRVVNLI